MKSSCWSWMFLIIYYRCILIELHQANFKCCVVKCTFRTPYNIYSFLITVGLSKSLNSSRPSAIES